jgi:hypothetical protein
VFKNASPLNSFIAQNIVIQPGAMSGLAALPAALNVIFNNATSQSLFLASPHFETNIKSIIVKLTDSVTVVLETYADVAALMTNAVAVPQIIAKPYAIKAASLSVGAMVAAVGSTTTMNSIFGDAPASALMAASTVAQSRITGSTTAMAALRLSSIGMAAAASSKAFVTAIYAVPAAWASFKASDFFADNLKTVVANLAGLNPTSFATLNDIIASASALASVAGSVGAMEALIGDATAVTTLSNSANLSVVAGSSVAMGVIASSSAITALVANVTSLGTLFASAVAKTALFASPAGMIAAINANAGSRAYLKGIQTLLLSSTVPSNGVWVPFASGLPAKILMLTYRQQGIGAIETPIRFRSPESVQLSMVGTAAIGNQIGRDHVGAYSNLEFNTTATSAATGSGIGFIAM